MTHMIGTSGLRGKSQVAFDLPPFAFRADPLMVVLFSIAPAVDITATEQAVVLTVRNDHLSERFCPFHSLAHHALRLHAFPVV